MAYMIDLKQQMCEQPHCERRATKIVRDRWNGTRGQYCYAHAREWVSKLTEKKG